MKVLTWNINGIRASKRSIKNVLDALDADIVCLQETKITRDMLDEPSAIVEGYNAYFSFSRKRTGYSGVANFCKDSVTPTGAEEGLSGLLTNHEEGRVGCYGNTTEFGSELLQALDAEGRAVLTKHQIQMDGGEVKDLTLINVYVPRAAADDERWTFKQRFLALLQCRAEALLREGSHVIILGDINTTHKKMDHCDPTTQEFLRIDSRQWINQLLREEDRDPELPPIEDRSSHEALTSHAEGGHFLDAFRFFHPDRTEAYTNWSTVTSARETNYGKRLDYMFVDLGLKECLVNCEIMPDFEGSDHCPVVLELRCTSVPSKICPPICTKFMPEFQGKQQKLLSFFSRVGTAKSAAKADRKDSQDSEKGAVGNGTDDSDLSGSSQSSVSNILTQTSSAPSNIPALPSLAIPSASAESANKLVPKVSEAAKSGLKRPGSDKLSDKNSKKKKKGASTKSTMSGRQASLLGFFRKSVPSSSGSNSSQTLIEEANSKYWEHESERGSGQGQGASQGQRQTEGHTGCPLPSMAAHLCSHGQQKGTCGKYTSLESGGTMSISASPEKQNKTNSPSKSPFTSASLASLECIAEESDKSKSETVKATNSSKTEANNTSQLENSEGKGSSQEMSKPTASTLWKGLLSGPPPPPLCKGHREPCVLRTVKKQGPNKGKQFYTCARPEGASTNKEARCDYFQWISHMGGKKGKS